MSDHLFEALDYIYSPSADVAAELADLERLLGGRVVFAIEDMGTRVALVELADGPPHLLLAGHLRGQRPVLVYRVASLELAVSALGRRGWKQGRTLELPMGSACAFTTQGGHAFAIYERSRPDVLVISRGAETSEVARRNLSER